MTHNILNGDNMDLLRDLPDNSIDAIVTDAPYGLGKEPDSVKMLSAWLATGHMDVKGGGFMGKAWDAFVPQPAFWKEAYRVLKPGAHLLSFFGTRTYDWGSLAIRLAGFEIRDMIAWVYGSGFPKSHNLDGDWQGWGTALKPALEPICVARKPLAGTVAQNVQQWSTGALNIGACRIAAPDGVPVFNQKGQAAVGCYADGLHGSERTGETDTSTGRWPANLIHDGSEDVLALFPETKTGLLKAGPNGAKLGYGGGAGYELSSSYAPGEGSAARYFYCAKASKKDRNEGCEDLPKQVGGMVSNTSGQHITRRDEGYEPQPQGNNHPTVKPTELMRYLVRLVTPPGGVVLDPFAGSGSTGKACALEGFSFIGFELDPNFCRIAEARIAEAQRSVAIKESRPQQGGLFNAI